MSITNRILLENSTGISEHDLIAASAYNGVITITNTITSEMSVNFALLLLPPT